jgi:hypothetical protein
VLFDVCDEPDEPLDVTVVLTWEELLVAPATADVGPPALLPELALLPLSPP